MAFKYKNALNLQGTEEEIQTALIFIQSFDHGPGSIDFDAITPMPEWVYTGTDEDKKERYGSENCAEGWCLLHWGVRENAIGLAESSATYDGGSTIEFDSMGGNIRMLVQKLSMIFPAIYLDYLWASEDVGMDSGMAQYQDGEVSMEYIPLSGSSQAYELCFDINGKTAEDYGLAYDPESSTYQYAGNLIKLHREDESNNDEI